MTIYDKIRSGGLFRCCIRTVQEHETPGTEKARLTCEWCETEMIFHDGTWEWMRPNQSDLRHTGGN